MEKFRIHIICQKPEICTLIRKSLSDNNYNVSCSDFEEVFVSKYLKRNNYIDCLILDRKLSRNVYEKVKEYFKDINMIYLPSLENEANDVLSGDRNISEPLRISELSKIVQNLYMQRKIE